MKNNTPTPPPALSILGNVLPPTEEEVAKMEQQAIAEENARLSATPYTTLEKAANMVDILETLGLETIVEGNKIKFPHDEDSHLVAFDEATDWEETLNDFASAFNLNVELASIEFGLYDW